MMLVAASLTAYIEGGRHCAAARVAVIRIGVTKES
jgi:hypothetical protein